mgnify:CR=1 FL=1
MKTLHVAVHDKVAIYQQRDGFIVCGNSDYKIQFAFDSEWDAYAEKTARFVWGGKYIDVEFTGDVCSVPIGHNTRDIKVGVYAGDLRTTTSATIRCERSILCEESKPSPENDKNYANEAKEKMLKLSDYIKDFLAENIMYLR